MVEEISAHDLAERLRSEGSEALTLLDVREDDEREFAAILPSVHVPMGEIVDRVETLSKDRPIVVYCHHGGRSSMVAHFLEDRGFERVFNLSGGIDAWSDQVDPKVPRY